VKALVQRVSRACVRVAGEETGSIGAGLVVLIGVARGDTERDADYVMQKVVNLRVFPDAEDRFNLSPLDIKGGLLLVSQFTLLADTRRGRRPDFTAAAAPDEAERLFDYCVELARKSGLPVGTGRFQQHMDVEIHNSGPVTVMLDSRDKFPQQ
jgi:D-tyrosyl-tRNA(Tyr) deacylase